jgi:hypothetical protein
MVICNTSTSLGITHEGALEFVFKKDASWRSQSALILLHYFDRQHPRRQSVALPCSDATAFGTAGTPSLSSSSHFKIECFDRKFFLVAEFPSILITIRFSLRLLEDGFAVSLEKDAISEGLPELYRVLSLEILPEFGAAKTGERGYLTLPNWSGCQTFFNKTYPRQICQTIYSSNDQWENNCNMPVFGITREQGTLCGLVAEGDYDAELVCRLHWEAWQLNSIHPRLIYRWEQQDPLIEGKREIQYRFATADDPSGEGYVFCGKTYRDFLRRERRLQTWSEKATARPASVDYRDRFFLKIFMAFKEPQEDGRGRFQTTCTFKEVRKILEICLARKMTRLAVVLVGWGRDGHDGMPPTRFPVDERLGGEAEFRNLADWCRQKGIMLAVHDSYGEGYECSPEFDPADVIQHRTGEPWQGIIWSGGRVHKLCPGVFVEKHTKRDIRRIRSLGVWGHHHIDAVGSFMTCHAESHPLKQRKEYTAQVAQMFRVATEEMGSVSTEMPFGPYFPEVDGLFHSYTDPSPWQKVSEVGRHFLDRNVPLLQTVLHGSVICGESVGLHPGDPLHWLDLGLSPTWEVCAKPADSFGIPAFSDALEEMSRIYDLYYGEEGLALRLNALEITGRREVAEKVSATCYSDGSEVRVNRSNLPFEDLAAGSYQILR